MRTPGPSHRSGDSQARTEALDTLNSFIVQAPAGSGKTELLTQRFLALLAQVEQPEEILAITFTRKAAAEMRARVVAALARAGDDTPPEPAHEKNTWKLARAAVARATSQGWNLAENPGRLGMFTIDALCARLASRAPVLSRAGAHPAVARDAQQLYRAAARALLRTLDVDEPVTRSLESLILHLDNNLQVVEDLLVAMLATRDHWLPRVTDPDNPRLQRRALEAALTASVARSLEHLAGLLPPETGQEIGKLAAFAADNLRIAHTESDIRACLGIDSLPAATLEAVPVWQGMRALLLKNDGDLRTTVTKAQGFPAASSGGDKAGKERLAAFKQRMLDVLEQLQQHPEFLKQLSNVRFLPTGGYSQTQWRLLQVLISLLPRAAAELSVVFGDSGEVDFTAMSHAALRALGEPDQPTDLALVLDYQVRHVLVDEFQDTSHSQAALLERLTAGWQAGDGHTLFIVGDPMQSIYRFREAEVGIFLGAREHGIGNLSLTPLQLTRNFRSQSGLVDWTSQSFAKLFPANEDVATGAVRFSPSEPVIEALADDAVTSHAVTRDSEAEQVFGIIQAARDEFPGGTVAVLVRARTHLHSIIAKLRRERVRFRAVEVEPLGKQAVVQDLHALTRAMLHLGDRGSWLSVLRAPWCGMTLHDLHTLASEYQSQTIWQAIIDEGRRQRLSEDGQLRLSRLKSVLANAMAQRGRRALRPWIEGTWTALGGPVCVQSDGLANAEAFLNLLDDVDIVGDIPSLEVLDDNLAKLYAAPDPLADNTLQLMTIHKAKGLEFDTVIVPGLDRRPRRSSDKLLEWLEITDTEASGELLLAPIRATGKSDGIQTYVQHLHAQRSDFETMRLLYVAATRARSRLHLLGQCSILRDGNVAPPSRNSLLAFLWPVVAPRFIAGAAAAVTANGAARMPHKPAVPKASSIRRLPSSWLLPEAPQPKNWASGDVAPDAQQSEVEYRWASDTARHVGTVVHRTLQEISVDGPEAWSVRWLDGLEYHLERLLGVLGVPQSELKDAADRATLAVRNTLADERGRWLLSRKHQDSRTEFAVSGWLDDVLVTGQLDRTFIDNNRVRWIVDYKTGAHEGGTVDGFLDNEMDRYQDQMTRYVRLMQRLDPTPVRVGLYFPMLQGWREWEP